MLLLRHVLYIRETFNPGKLKYNYSVPVISWANIYPYAGVVPVQDTCKSPEMGQLLAHSLVCPTPTYFLRLLGSLRRRKIILITELLGHPMHRGYESEETWARVICRPRPPGLNTGKCLYWTAPTPLGTATSLPSIFKLSWHKFDTP